MAELNQIYKCNLCGNIVEVIELIADGRVCRKYLKPGDKPEFEFGSKPAQYAARAYCNIHGLWKS